MVPKAAKRCRACTSVFTVLALMLLAAPAFGAANPTFTYGKPEEVKAGAPPPPPVEWKAMTKAGMPLTTGNSQTTNGTLALAISRRESGNKFAFDGAIAYGQSNELVPSSARPADPTMMAGQRHRTPAVTTTNNWQTKARYDRFFTANNSGYAVRPGGRRSIAGKSFAGGGRSATAASCSRTTSTCGQRDRLRLSYERYVAQPGRSLDPVSIHSARAVRGRDDEDFADQRRDRERRGAFQPEPRSSARRQHRHPGRRRVPRYPRRRQAGPHHDACSRA